MVNKIKEEEKMRIGGIGFIPSTIKWVIDYITESFSDGNLEDFMDLIEIWGTKSNGYDIEFKLSSTGMIFYINIKGKYFLLSAALLECRTSERRYLLKREGLGAGFNETIARMKVLMLDELDSILKVKK